MTDIVERLANWDTAHGLGDNLMRDIRNARAEIERLRAAKTAALKVADERSKENVELRAELATARDGLSVMDANHRVMAKQLADTARALQTMAEEHDRVEAALTGDVFRLTRALDEAQAALREISELGDVRADEAETIALNVLKERPPTTGMKRLGLGFEETVENVTHEQHMRDEKSEGVR